MRFPMLVLLMRHGERERTAPGSDADRRAPLTARGVQDIEDVARQLAGKLAGRSITHALSSPHCAALETAKRLLDILRSEIAPSPHPSLDPDPGIKRDPRPLTLALDSLSADADCVILVVGHQPLLYEVGRHWTGGYVSPDNGEVAGIRKCGQEAEFLWMLKPGRNGGSS